jgi:hypothetical protein
MLHLPLLPLNLTFIHSLCNVHHHQRPLPLLHALYLQIRLFVRHLPSLQNINAENLHAAATSLSEGRKKETKTTSNVQKMLSSSSDGNVVKIASKLRTLQRRMDRQRSRGRLIFPRQSVSSGRVCRQRNVSSGSRWLKIRKRSTSSYTPTMFIVRNEPRTRMARRRTRRSRKSTKTRITAFLSSSQFIVIMVVLHLHPLRLLISPSKFQTSTT